MIVVRAETKDTRLTVHGLKHRLSDKLGDAEAPVEVRRGFLGYLTTATAESAYVSPRAMERLQQSYHSRRTLKYLRDVVEANTSTCSQVFIRRTD